MSTNLVAASTAISPRDVARDLMGTIRLIEEALESSGQEISRVEGRGALKNLFSSSRDDLVAISRSQNRINDLMLDMIREIITLNVMSYSYMAGVLEEFMRMSKSGWKDKDGQIQRLSTTGKEFADTAARIFAKIMDGARSTQQAIELNAVQIEDVRKTLLAKESVDAEQSLELQRIDGDLARKAEVIAGLRSVLAEKAGIDERQSRELEAMSILIDETSGAVAKLHVLLQEKARTDEDQTAKLAALEQQSGLQRKQLAGFEDALGLSVAGMRVMNRRIAFASVAAAAVGCASAIVVMRLIA